ncbi:MAG: glycosyltransferase, partial [Tepidiformaceae bacterium]
MPPPPPETTASPALSVVVPAHDEAETIPSLLAEIHAALDGEAAYEVVFVDDGSADGTGERLATLAAADAGLRV